MPHPLYIEKLVEIFPAFEPSFLLMLTYAGAVCFNERGHRYGVTLRVSGDYEKEYAVFWPAITDRIRRTWVDIDYATEHGAYGVAFMLINDLTGYAILEQSYRGTGFDYWLGEDSDMPFQRKARLEVSGIRSGSKREIASRVQQKLKQTKASDGKLPAYIVVVEFGTPQAKVVQNVRSQNNSSEGDENRA